MLDILDISLFLRLQNIGLSNDSAIRSFAKFTLPSPTVVELIFPSSSRGDSNTKKDCGVSFFISFFTLLACKNIF